MGSGTTAAVSKKLNRNFLGCEIDKRFYKYSLEKIKINQKDLAVFFDPIFIFHKIF